MPGFHKKNIVIGFAIVIFVLAAILRFWQLGKIPVSMSDDETRLSYSAYSIWKTGRDLNGKFLPLSFVINGYSFNPVPIYLVSPFVGILGLSMFSARLPFALAGILTVFLVYLVAKMLTQNKWLGLLSALVLAVSVWHLTLSRLAYEGGMALMFFTLGTYLFLLVKKKSYKILIGSLIFLTLGFFSYSGYKLTYLPLVVFLAWFQRKELVLKQFFVVFISVAFTFGLLFYLGKTQGALKYGGDLVFFQDKKTVADAVELERRATIAPEFLKQLYHNKFTYIFQMGLSHYLYGYSPQYLLTDQEASGIFSVWSRGQLYYHEALLLLLGILFVFLKNRQQFFLILGLLILAGLPAGLGPGPFTYTIRDSFELPWLSILIAGGIISFGTFVKNRKIQSGFFALIGLLYFYFVTGYLTQYYFDWSRYGAKYYSLADRDLANLITKNKNKQIYVSGTSLISFLNFAFYEKLPPQTVQRNFQENKIKVGNVVFDNSCPELLQDEIGVGMPENSLFVISGGCYAGQKTKILPVPNAIIKSAEGQSEWYIYEE